MKQDKFHEEVMRSMRAAVDIGSREWLIKNTDLLVSVVLSEIERRALEKGKCPVCGGPR